MNFIESLRALPAHVWAQLALFAFLAWSVMCRVRKTNLETRREVRAALAFEGAITGLVFGAPFLPLFYPGSSIIAWPAGTTPLGIWMLFGLSILGVQLTTAKYWIAGVPANLQNPQASNCPEFDAPSIAHAERRGRNQGGSWRGMAMCIIAAAILAVALGSHPPVATAASIDDEAFEAQFVPEGRGIACTMPGGCSVLSPATVRQLLQTLEAADQAIDSALQRCSARMTRS